MKVLRPLVLLAMLAASSCSREHATPLAPAAEKSVEIVQVFPPPRATGIPYDTDVSARFDRDLDAATLNDTTVSLRVDASYVPIDIFWDAEHRELRLHPRRLLWLSRTHTVTLGTGIRSVDGVRLSKPYSWQFKMNGIGLPASPQPADRTLGESRFARLAWRGLDPGAGTVVYDVYFGTDSAVVADHRTLPRRTTSSASWLHEDPWPSASTVFWAVTVRNTTTGEQADGPVWQFATLPADAPTDSVVLALSDWGYQYRDSQDGAILEDCFKPKFLAGGSVLVCAIRWDLRPYAGRKVAGAKILLRRGSIAVQGFTTLYSALDDWNACDLQAGISPRADAFVGFGHGYPGEYVEISTDRLAAHLEASLRYPGYRGYVVEANTRTDYLVSGSSLILTLIREPSFKIVSR